MAKFVTDHGDRIELDPKDYIDCYPLQSEPTYCVRATGGRLYYTKSYVSKGTEDGYES